MREFVIQLGHRVGEMARVTNALSLYGVNIKSVAAMTFGDTRQCASETHTYRT